MIPTVLRCSRIGRAKLVHIRFGNAWFFSLSSSSFYRLPNGRVISPKVNILCVWVSLTDESRGEKKRNKEATNISNISPCDGVLIPIVVDPIKKRSTEGFLSFFFPRKIRLKKEMNLDRAKGKGRIVWTNWWDYDSFAKMLDSNTETSATAKKYEKETSFHQIFENVNAKEFFISVILKWVKSNIATWLTLWEKNRSDHLKRDYF